MLIRICLILAIVAGLAAGIIAHLQVEKKIVTVRDDRDLKLKERDEARKERDDTKMELDNTKKELDTTKTELTTTKGQLEDANKRAAEADTREKKAVADLATANRDKKSLQDELTPWRGLGKTLDVVKKTLADHPRVVDERNALVAENKILQRRVDKLSQEVAELRGEDPPPVPLPQGLKGKIVQVDPKYDFVVLDIGGNQGVLERGEMLINRRGRLIGKVRITSVMPDKSIANVLKPWKQDEPFEGDEVLY